MMVFLILATGVLVPRMALRAPQDASKPPETAAVELSSQEKSDPLTAARHLIEQREIPGHLDRAELVLEWRKDHGSESSEVHALLAEAHSRMVEALNPEKAEDRRRLKPEREKGLREAREAVRLAPSQSEGHYWLGWL